MAKLSQFAERIRLYIEAHGDKDVTSIAVPCGSPVDYVLNLHDIYEGPIGSNPYTGEDKLEIYKDSPWSEKSRAEAPETKEPETNPMTAKALLALRKLAAELEKQEDKSVYSRMAMLWGAVVLAHRMCLIDNKAMHTIWNEFALKQLDL